MQSFEAGVSRGPLGTRHDNAWLQGNSKRLPEWGTLQAQWLMHTLLFSTLSKKIEHFGTSFNLKQLNVSILIRPDRINPFQLFCTEL